MSKFNGILHTLKVPGAIVGCLIIITTLSAWYKAYADKSAITTETLKTHTEDIVELKETDKKIIIKQDDQQEILMEMRELWKLAYPKMYEKAKEKVAVILDSLNNNPKSKYSTDSLRNN